MKYQIHSGERAIGSPHLRSGAAARSPPRRSPPRSPPTPASAVPTQARKPSKRPEAEAEAEAVEPSRRNWGEGEGEGAPVRRKRKRDEVESGYERRTLVAAPAEEEVQPRLVVGDKRKAPHDVEAVASGGEEDEVFDDEGKLLRTFFVENLPLRTKKKALTKEFTTFGMVDSVRIRSVPLGDVEVNNAPPVRRPQGRCRRPKPSLVKSAKRMPRGPPRTPDRRSASVATSRAAQALVRGSNSVSWLTGEKRQGQVQAAVARKKKAVHKTATTDDKWLQSMLKRVGVNTIPAIEEVNIFKDDLVIQFFNPKGEFCLLGAAASSILRLIKEPPVQRRRGVSLSPLEIQHGVSGTKPAPTAAAWAKPFPNKLNAIREEGQASRQQPAVTAKLWPSRNARQPLDNSKQGTVASRAKARSSNMSPRARRQSIAWATHVPDSHLPPTRCRRVAGRWNPTIACLSTYSVIGSCLLCYGQAAGDDRRRRPSISPSLGRRRPPTAAPAKRKKEIQSK
ncbi:hypothetical protein ZWY2020_029616 [Hordeum vulgare]|nr:hypothetical protein ZWY2020_029616 [Hordeum vulgare]